jgi:hypothetical protein
MELTQLTKRDVFTSVMWRSSRPEICFYTVVAGVASIGQRSARATEAEAHTTWSAYEGEVDSDQYSALKQINRSNANQLQQVWFYSVAGALDRPRMMHQNAGLLPFCAS